MNNIIQIERLRYAKICGERRLLQDLINNCPGNGKNLNHKGHCAQGKAVSKIILESSCSKISQNSIGYTWTHPRWIPALVAGHKPLYLQKLKCAACCP